MDIFFWIIDLLIPILMILIGFMFIKKPPKNINIWYGYRTKMSMKSQEAWDFAHKMCGRLWIKLGILILVIIVLSKLFNPINVEILSLIHVGIGLLAICTPIYFIEKALHKKFNN